MLGLSPGAEYMEGSSIRRPAGIDRRRTNFDLSLLGGLQIADRDVPVGQVSRAGDHGVARAGAVRLAQLGFERTSTECEGGSDSSAAQIAGDLRSGDVGALAERGDQYARR